jgi:hypothetical protein
MCQDGFLTMVAIKILQLKSRAGVLKSPPPPDCEQHVFADFKLNAHPGSNERALPVALLDFVVLTNTSTPACFNQEDSAGLSTGWWT